MIKKTIKSNKLLFAIYQNLRYPKLSRIRYIFENVNKVITKNNLNGMFFDGKNSWVRVYENIEFLYVPSKFGGLLGLEKKSGFESVEVDFVSRNFKDGHTFIDIGANFGLYSIFVAKKFNNCNIHSFEPLPETFEIFKKKY
ncbi:MAG: FkbM family methyltransferase [Sulfurovum sp.]|nr:FkbM family methyltransferase [Sulfurovum sp.]